MAAEAGLKDGVGLPFSGPRSLQGGVTLASQAAVPPATDINILWSIANLYYRRARQLMATQLVPDRCIELTSREIDILSLSANGHTDRSIAANLEISQNTVATHLKKIYRKFGARTRVQAFAMAVRQRIIDLP
jgi:DNA-binding CsgD family transcriptional regulator